MHACGGRRCLGGKELPQRKAVGWVWDIEKKGGTTIHRHHHHPGPAVCPRLHLELRFSPSWYW